MSQFIQADGDYYPLSQIGKLSSRKNEHGQRRWVAYDTDLRQLGWTPHSFHPEQDLSPVIPAGFRISAAVVYCFDAGCRPTEEHVQVEFHLIVAWRIICGTAEPIFFEGLGGDPTVALPMDGDLALYMIPEDTSGLTLNALRNLILKRAQDQWDEKHPQEAA